MDIHLLGLGWEAVGDPLVEGLRLCGAMARFAAILHHTDAEREWAYDRTSHIGKLDKALGEAWQKAGPWST